jgi:hypothetical protein
MNDPVGGSGITGIGDVTNPLYAVDAAGTLSAR